MEKIAGREIQVLPVSNRYLSNFATVHIMCGYVRIRPIEWNGTFYVSPTGRVFRYTVQEGGCNLHYTDENIYEVDVTWSHDKDGEFFENRRIDEEVE